MDAASTLVAIAGAFLLAGFVKGVIGLGLPTVSIGLLGLLMTRCIGTAAGVTLLPRDDNGRALCRWDWH